MESFQSQLSQSFINLAEKLGEWINIFILQLPNILIAVMVGVIAVFFSKYVRKATRKATNKLTHNQTVLKLVSNLSTVIFGVLALFLILSILNLGGTINKILATAGVLGLAVGLALQDPMNNLFSGIFMSVRDLYNIGDLVETNGFFGTIIDFDLRVTKLRLPTGQLVIIPNKEVIQNPLKNYTSSGERRVDISCGVSYGDDLDKVENLVIPEIKKLPAVLDHKPVDLVFNEFGDSSINFLLRFWIDTTAQRDYLVEQSNAIKTIKTLFDQNDIMIPFPIRTLDFGIKGGVGFDEVARSTNNFNKIRGSVPAVN